MTKQGTFNRVARHLMRQMRRAVNDGGEPVLHAMDGLRCAAGVLVARKDYNPRWEEWSGVSAFSKSRLCLYLEAKGHDLQLVHDLQFVHDHTPPRRDGWDRALRSVARTHDLNPAVVAECIAERAREAGLA